MLKRTTWTGALAMAMLVPPSEVSSVEPLSTAELVSHCEHYPTDPTGVDALICVSYIQGFIDGAVATDERVAQNVASEKEEVEETYAERAIRTRLGPRLKHKNTSYYAEFCLGAPVPMKEVTERVIHDLLDREIVSHEQRALHIVYRTLREQYPCGEED